MIIICLVLFSASPVVGAGKMGGAVRRLFERVVNDTLITSAYLNLTTEIPLNHSALIKHIADLASEEFNEAFTAIKNLRDAGKSSYLNHSWSTNNTNNYWNSFTHPLRSTNGSYLDLEYDERYKDYVSYNYSVVNIPVDVFENWTEVKNTIQWTKNMNKMFIANQQSRPHNIYWQYIGTPQGVMRFYPGFKDRLIYISHNNV